MVKGREQIFLISIIEKEEKNDKITVQNNHIYIRFFFLKNLFFIYDKITKT